MDEIHRFIDSIDDYTGPVTVSVRDLEHIIDTGKFHMLFRKKFSKYGHYNFLQSLSYRIYIMHNRRYRMTLQIKLHEQLIKCALENGANPNLDLDDYDFRLTPLKLCSRGMGTWNICRMLIKHGAEVIEYKNLIYNKSSNPTGQTLATLARFHLLYPLMGLEILQRMFIDAGADPMALSDDEYSALTEQVWIVCTRGILEYTHMITFYIEC